MRAAAERGDDVVIELLLVNGARLTGFYGYDPGANFWHNWSGRPLVETVKSVFAGTFFEQEPDYKQKRQAERAAKAMTEAVAKRRLECQMLVRDNA